VIGTRQVVDAFFRCEQHRGRGGIDVELREMPATTDPRSGEAVWVPPTVILWVQERPLAVRVRSLIVINRFAPLSSLANVIEGAADAYGLPVEHVCEAGLWRLFQVPPRLRAAG
jgi:hypothetical protein